MTLDAWSQTSGSLPGRGQANAIGLVPSTLRLPPHTTIRRRPLTIASAMNPSAANGSMSGHSAAKWCELRIATAAIPCRRAFSRSSGALARNAGWAKPLAASVATSPGAASVTTGTARPSTQPLFKRRDITRQPQQPVAGGAVALGRDDRFGNRSGVFCRHAVSAEDPDDEIGQFDGR